MSMNLSSTTANISSIGIYYLKIEKALALLPIALVIFGTIGNCVALYVLTTKRLRNYSTMIYFASLTIVDTVSLYQWNFNFFYRYHLNMNNLNLEETSLFLCRYISYMAYFSLMTSAWILTLICIDRYLILTSTYWKLKSKNARFSLALVAFIVLTCACLNIPIIFLNGEIPKRNRAKVACYTTPYAVFWEKSILYLEAIIPLSIMILFNCLLIYKTHKSAHKVRKKCDVKHQVTSKAINLLLPTQQTESHSTPNAHAHEECEIVRLTSSHNDNCNPNETKKVVALNYIIPHARLHDQLKRKQNLVKHRNEKIVIMLVLLTASFAISTLPSSLFYAYFRRHLSDKPYRRVLTSIFTCLRHLSHTFNFLIYFIYSSMIRSELKQCVNETIKFLRLKLQSKRSLNVKIPTETLPEFTASHTSIEKKRQSRDRTQKERDNK